jgi:hypothetical protein
MIKALMMVISEIVTHGVTVYWLHSSVLTNLKSPMNLHYFRVVLVKLDG